MVVAPLVLLLAVAGDGVISGETGVRGICMGLVPTARIRGDEAQKEAHEKRRKELLALTYEAILPASALETDGADDAARELSYKRRNALRTRDGATLYLEDRDVDLTVPEGAKAEGLGKLQEALAADPKASFRLRFKLDDVPGEGPCRGGVKPGATPVLQVEAVGWELLDREGQVVATGTGKAAVEGRKPAGGAPQVEVSPATVDGVGPLASVVTDKAQAAGPKLRTCFEQALAKDPTVDGSLVFSVAIDRDGKAKDVLVTADTASDDGLTACASAVLATIPWGKGGPGTALIPVHFERR